jgi:hypothetical protein
MTHKKIILTHHCRIRVAKMIVAWFSIGILLLDMNSEILARKISNRIDLKQSPVDLGEPHRASASEF